MVGIVNKVYYFLLLTIISLFIIFHIALVYRLYFIYLFIPLPSYTSTVRPFLRSFIPLLSLDQWSVLISLFMVKYSNLVAVFTHPHIRLRVPTFFLRVVPCICVRFFGKLWFSLESLPGMWSVVNLINKTPRWWNFYIVRSFTFLRRPWSLTHVTVHDILSLTSPDNIDAAFSARVKIRCR